MLSRHNNKTTTMSMPTELRKWLKDQMRAIENNTLEPDKAMMILTMLDEYKHTSNATIMCEIIDELKAEKKKKKKKLIIVCAKCQLIECCCEEDRLQVLKDDADALKRGYAPVNENGDVRWKKTRAGLPRQ